MRRYLLLFSLLIVGAICYTVVGDKDETPANPASERREVREARRAQRQAEMEHMIDSIVVARAYIFYPQTIQLEPAGRMTNLSNPNFELRVWRGAADIFMPYISGFTPPYRHTIFNSTVTILNDYISRQSENGWNISFQADLYNASGCTFELDVSSKFGTTTLTIDNPWGNDVEYTGILSQI